MFSNPVLLDVLAGRGIEDIDAFLEDPPGTISPIQCPFLPWNKLLIAS